MAGRSASAPHPLASAPWPVGVIAGVLVLVAGKLIVPAVLASTGNPILAALVEQVHRGALDPLLWFLAGACWLAAIMSLAGRASRRRLLAAQSDLQALRALTWRQFEQLVGEAWRRRGYEVEETGQGGADGGIDLILRRTGSTMLVQCKHWKTRKVDVATVREQLGLVTHYRATGAIVVTTGEFTAEARAFAASNPIELVSGSELLALIRDVQGDHTIRSPPLPVATVDPGGEPLCPKCGERMVERRAARTGAAFYGCSRFPACRGTRLIEVGRAVEKVVLR